jgi:hypothetical protein
MNKKDDNYFQIDNGNVQLWIEQDQLICLKAVTKEGDPVELSEEEAKELLNILQVFIGKIE